MSAAKLVACTMLCLALCGNAHAQSLTVYSRTADSLDSRTQYSLNQELTRLLSPAGIHLDWKSETQDTREEEGRLIVGSFNGSCSSESLPAYSDSTESATLAQTSISDGRILPYFSVDCPRVIRTLAPTLRHLSVPFRDALLGRALARVIAHEIYHILAQTPDHEESGLSKAQLSFADLTVDRFELSPDSLRRIRASIQTARPVPVAGLVSPSLPRRR